MAIAPLTDAFSTAASLEESFVDKDLLYVAGGLLVLLALGFSFAGMKMKDFPSSNQLKVVIGLTAVVVLVTGFGALQTARFEQAERRLENEEAAKEAEQQELEKEEALDEDTAGESADPESGSGATPGGGAQSDAGGNEDIDAGRTLFVDTGCGGCHVLADAESTGQVGPDLDESVAGMDAEQVRTAIVDPSAEVAQGFPDGAMPVNYGEQLDEVQLDTLVNYLITVTKG